MVAAVSALLRSMGGSEQYDHLESLLGSLWPDQLEDREKGFDHQTVHAVIAAAVQSIAHPERGAPGSVTTRSPEAPKDVEGSGETPLQRALRIKCEARDDDHSY
jgi:hypothetical protein